MQEPNKYVGKQILVTSNRLLLISRNSDIFLNSHRTISLSCNESIHIDSGKHTIINSSEIFLGLKSVDRSQPNLRGEDVRNILSQLINSLETLISFTEKSPSDIPSTLMTGLGYVQGTIKEIKSTYSKDLNKVLSTKTFVE